MPQSLRLPILSSSNFILITLNRYILHVSFTKSFTLKIGDNPYINLSPSPYSSVQTPRTLILPIRTGITNRHGSMPSYYKIQTIVILGFSTSIMTWILQTFPSSSSNGGTTMVVMLTTSNTILWLKMVTFISKIIFNQLLLKGSSLPFLFLVQIFLCRGYVHGSMIIIYKMDIQYLFVNSKSNGGILLQLSPNKLAVLEWLQKHQTSPIIDHHSQSKFLAWKAQTTTLLASTSTEKEYLQIVQSIIQSQDPKTVLSQSSSSGSISPAISLGDDKDDCFVILPPIKRH